MEDVSWEYLAGIIDGEGCILITRTKNVKDAKRHIKFTPLMTIANTHIPLLEKLQRNFGGRIRGANYNRYALTFSADDIRRILPKLIPFMIIKREQANVILDYLEKVSQNGFAPISDELFKFYEGCYWKLRDMKKIRYSYDQTPKKIGNRVCLTCLKSFDVFTNNPRKKYCSVGCKTKAVWMRSNKRIKDGIPAWYSVKN